MHDPMTVAFDIGYPFGGPGTFITIWHRDPQRDGTDDSCDWFGNRRKLNDREAELNKAIADLLHTLGNRPFYPMRQLYGTDPHGNDPAKVGTVGRLNMARRKWRKRRFRIHPRWHFWHWRIQIHPLQSLRRWLFVRCGHCSERFGWSEAAITYSWSGKGPIFHDRCTLDYERSSAADRLIDETVSMPDGAA